MKLLVEYELIEDENRLNINMSNWNRKVLCFFYSLFFITEIFFIGFSFFLLIKFKGSIETFAFWGFVLIFSFIIFIVLLYDLVPYNIIVEPERIILFYDRFFLGKKEDIIYKYKLTKLSSRKIIVKGQTRLEILIKTNEKKTLKILRFDYNKDKKEYINNIYLRIAEKLGIDYDVLPV